jgi:hypothetical protein
LGVFFIPSDFTFDVGFGAGTHWRYLSVALNNLRFLILLRERPVR